MPVVLEVFPQPLPRPVVLGGELFEWRRPELGVEREETRNLERVEIADQTQTASPRVAVAISRDEVPPQLHLRLQRRPQRVEEVLASGNLRRVPEVSRVLVGVAIVAASGQGVVREERPGGELHGS